MLHEAPVEIFLTVRYRLDLENSTTTRRVDRPDPLFPQEPLTPSSQVKTPCTIGPLMLSVLHSLSKSHSQVIGLYANRAFFKLCSDQNKELNLMPAEVQSAAGFNVRYLGVIS